MTPTPETEATMYECVQCDVRFTVTEGHSCQEYQAKRQEVIIGARERLDAVEQKVEELGNPAAVPKVDSAYDDPEFQAELAANITDKTAAWRHDWSVLIDALVEALGLTRMEVMLYLLLSQVGMLRGLGVGFQAMWNAGPQKRRRSMEDTLLKMELEIAAKELGLELIETPAQPTQPPGAKPGWKIQ